MQPNTKYGELWENVIRSFETKEEKINRLLTTLVIIVQ